MIEESVKLKYISRIDTSDTHGWYVRIKKKDMNYQKLFSDKKLGNKDWALVQALIYSGECLEQIDTEFKKTDHIVHRKVTKYSRGYAYDVYEVAWQFRSQIKKKSFAVKKYGETVAKEKAERWAANVRKQLSLSNQS